MLIISNLTIVLKKDLRTLIKDFSFVLNKKDKVGIIGEEGNGKSSLLKVLYNPEEASKYLEITGNISIKDEKIGYLPQMIDEEKLNLSINELLNKEIDYSLLDYKKYYQYIDTFHLDEEKLFSNEIKVRSLSGGERIKLFLLIELMKVPTILVLDEPSNDLDLSSLNLIEELIKNIDIPVMFISHDESLLSKCANKIIHIESLKSKSEPRVTVKSLNYDDYFTSREDFLDKNIQEYKKDKENFEKKMDKFNKVYQSVNYALNTVSRSQPSVAKNLKDKMHAVKSMEKRYAKEKETLTQKYEVEEGINLKFDNLNILDVKGNSSNSKNNYLIDPSKVVLDLNIEELKINNEITLIDKPISFYIKGSKKIAIIGENGAGKSTLIKLIYEELVSKSSFNVGYMSQNYEDELLNYMSPLDYLAKEIGASTKEELTKIQTYLGSLKFTYEEMNRSISSLSGGQKAKIFFTKLILKKVNVMLLDEPTRNISPLSNKSFIKSIKQYKGVIIAVSHDRNFIYQVFDEIYELSSETGLQQIQRDDFKKKYLWVSFMNIHSRYFSSIAFNITNIFPIISFIKRSVVSY